MVMKGDKDWLEAIAESAGVTPETASRVLNSRAIRPSPVVATPRRLSICRIAFSGEKTGIPAYGSFEFDWPNLGPGLWAALTDRNLKGKSSVIEIVRWMLRGCPSSNLQQDVRGWLQRCNLRFSLDDAVYEVQAKTPIRVSGRLVRIDSSGTEAELATFAGDSEFEAVMSDFFLRELSLDVVTRWKGGAEDEGGMAVLHSWPSLSSAMFIGTDYSVLLGDMPAASGMTVPLMQMYLGLPWVSTLTAAKAAEQGAIRANEARQRRRKIHDAERKDRQDGIRAELEQKRRERDATPSDSAIRAEIARLQHEFGKSTISEIDVQTRLQRESAAFESAEAAYLTDRKELQSHIDAEAAGAVFRILDPAFCPRCDAAITIERRKREKDAHSCSVCGEHVGDSEDDGWIRTGMEARVKASKSARDKAANCRDNAQTTLDAIRERILELAEMIEAQVSRLSEFGARQRLDQEVAILQARLQEATFSPEADVADEQDARVLKAAAKETEKRVKAVQEGILKEVSTEIVRYAQRFGMTNLTSATLKGNTHLRLTKGGNETGYGSCTPGEKLRLKVAAVLAMIRVAEEGHVGRHPGMLMIDSPGAQEVSRPDLDQLISGLEEVSKEFAHLQVFVAARASPSILDHVPMDKMRYEKGDAALW